jgi:hypothetical protein
MFVMALDSFSNTERTRIWPAFEWRYLLLLPVAAGIVHLLATFIAMSDTRNGAYKRLQSAMPNNSMKILQPITPDHQPLPFLSPDARYAICRFSSRAGPVEVKAVLPDRGWTLGVYHPDGTTAYFAAGSAKGVSAIALTLIAGDDRFMGLSPQALGKQGSTIPGLTVTARDGLIVVRAPDRGAAYRQSDEEILAKASCAAQSF